MINIKSKHATACGEQQQNRVTACILNWTGRGAMHAHAENKQSDLLFSTLELQYPVRVSFSQLSQSSRTEHLLRGLIPSLANECGY